VLRITDTAGFQVAGSGCRFIPVVDGKGVPGTGNESWRFKNQA
jgi:hypothetical protein